MTAERRDLALEAAVSVADPLGVGPSVRDSRGLEQHDRLARAAAIPAWLDERSGMSLTLNLVASHSGP